MSKLVFLVINIFVLVLIDLVLPKAFPLSKSDNYLLGFEKFLSTAKETFGEERIILVGGSSLGWGVSSEKLTKNLGIITLNSGIHAGIGYRNFLRTLEDVSDKERDLIVISPEYNIVSGGGALGRSDEFCFITIYVRGELPIDCIGYSLSSFAKISPILNRNKPANDQDEYIRNGFNDYGDYTYRVDGVNMIGKMDNVDLCSGWDIQDLSDKYMPFIDRLIHSGYEIVYVPNFIPSAACRDIDKLNQFHQMMFGKYGIQSFDDVQLLFDEKYFYNTAYHLTKAGVDLKTNFFQNQLKHYLKNR